MLKLFLKRFSQFQISGTSSFQLKLISQFSLKKKIQKVKIQSLEQFTKKQKNNDLKFMSEENTSYMFTNYYFQTLEKNKTIIQKIKSAQNCKFISNFQSALQETSCFKHNKQKQRSIVENQQLQLIVGDYNAQFFNLIDNSRILTLEQLCSIFPQKIPLSYRSKNTTQKRRNLQKRLNKDKQTNLINLDIQPVFSRVIFCHQNVKMWDQAIQVILDCLPVPIIFPYHKNRQQQKFYTLTQKDFILGLKTCHDIIHKKDYPMQIKEFTIIEHLKYLLSKIEKKLNQNQNSEKVLVQVEKQMIQSQEANDNNLRDQINCLLEQFRKYQIRFV